MDFEIRAGRDDDAWDLVGLVAGCWSEYPGCVLDVHGEEPDLLAIASAYDAKGGRFWVVERDGRLIASIGIAPAPEQGSVLLQKLYVARSVRRLGLGKRLVGLVESQAAELGAARELRPRAAAILSQGRSRRTRPPDRLRYARRDGFRDPRRTR